MSTLPVCFEILTILDTRDAIRDSKETEELQAKGWLAVELTDEKIEDELTNVTILRLVGGEDPLTVKASLHQQLDATIAGRVFQAATSQIDAARRSGTLNELEQRKYFAKRPSAAYRSRAGLNVLILGVGATALSYFFAPPGATFTIFVGFIAYGVWLLISG